MMSIFARSLVLIFALALGLGSCDPDESVDTPANEGSQPGDCADGDDNDTDGLSDCDDDGCADSADCAGDDDSAGDDDDSAGDDDDGAGDDDSVGDDDDSAAADDDDDSSGDDDDVPPPPSEDCGNKEDDDADGAVDCADSDCDSYPPCFGGECGVEVDTEDQGCGDGVDGDCDGFVDCEDVDDCCFYTDPGQDCESSSFCGSGDDDSNGDDDDSSGFPPCCDTQTCADNVAECGGDPDNVCEQQGMPWQGDQAGDGPDHCADFSEAACPSCYDGVDGDNDGGADCLDPEALAVQAGGDLSVNIPNCYVVRFCDLDPSNDCPL